MKRKYISPLQYITQGSSLAEIEHEVKTVLNGGCDWVQLRMKDVTAEELTSVAIRVREMCYSYNATFIVNDNPYVALECKADGVHLGKGDMPTSVLRWLDGNKLIVGRTANTVSDVTILSKHNIDYIGLGPYQYTTTKKNLSATLGVDGYCDIFSTLRDKGINPHPIVAIGGITFEDISTLSKVDGLHGIAVSGALYGDKGGVKRTMEFVSEVERCFEVKNYSLK